MRCKKVRTLKYLSFLGFMSFLGFNYFRDGNLSDLRYFAYIGFFAFYFVYKVSCDIPDERYFDNRRNAFCVGFKFALLEMFILSMCVPLDFFTKQIITTVCSLGFGLLLIVYSIAFYYYERK